MDPVCVADSGVSTAWLLATIGPRTIYRRVSRKDISTICIPQTCQLLSTNDAFLLRIASSLMYGIALIHHHQVRQCLDHAALLQQRLQKQAKKDPLIRVAPEVYKFAPLEDSGSFLMLHDFAPWDGEWFNSENVFQSVSDKIQHNLQEHTDEIDYYDALERSVQNLCDFNAAHEDPGLDFDVNGHLETELENDLFLDFNEEIRQAALPLEAPADPHFATAGQIPSRPTRKCRKRVVVDPAEDPRISDSAFRTQLNYYPNQKPQLEDAFKRRRTNVHSLVNGLSLAEPHALNYYRNYLLGDMANEWVPAHRQPNMLRRTVEEVEQGRNSGGLEIRREKETAVDTSLDDFEQEHMSQVAAKLLSHLQEVGSRFGERSDGLGRSMHSNRVHVLPAGPRRITLTELFPAKTQTSKKCAAKHFATVLELATRAAVQLELQGVPKLQAGTADNIYITLSD